MSFHYPRNHKSFLSSTFAYSCHTTVSQDTMGYIQLVDHHECIFEPPFINSSVKNTEQSDFAYFIILSNGG